MQNAPLNFERNHGFELDEANNLHNAGNAYGSLAPPRVTMIELSIQARGLIDQLLMVILVIVL